MTQPRDYVRSIFDAGVAAADPALAIAPYLEGMVQPVLIVAAGKAAVPMAEQALRVFLGVPTRVVTHYENVRDIVGATVMAAGHPVPDENGAAGAEAVLSDVAAADGPVLALISGGASALLPAPVAGVLLADKMTLNGLLLGAGLDITQMNIVRQSVSRIKGGGLARTARGSVTGLVLSDVVGGDVSVIASGPTAPALGGKSKARAVLQNAGIWGQTPSAIRAHLERDEDVPPPLTNAINHIVGSNEISVAAMALACPEAKVLPPVEGDVAQAAMVICDAAGAGVTLWGGETTVLLRGDGRGGRNQELALRIALEAKLRGWTNWTCLQGGSDGRDGPTDAAGAIVDDATLDRIAAAGGDIQALLANNDSYAALALSDDLLIMGATGTNIADLGVLIRGT